MKWVLPKPVEKTQYNNSSLCSILQKILIRRGLTINTELDEFLTPSELPNSGDHFGDLEKATNRIISACNNQSKIAICGDYDADGITSTVLLFELLSDLGANAIPYIPSRLEDGYGLNKKMINDINNNNIKLVITVDNGISAFEAIKESEKFGIDLIITDHHKIPKNIPDIFALIHPELSPDDSPYKCLAGVGIAYMLSKYICKKILYDINNTNASSLFCIGTVADMAPLVGANRKWLKECLPSITNSYNFGIQAIVHQLKFDNVDITTDDIGYKIAPIINAVGRISHPNIIIDLLTTKSEKEAKRLAKECIVINQKRKLMTTSITKEALDLAYEEVNNNFKFILLSNNDWHSGIIGIVAAKILDKFNLPTAILSRSADGFFRGSVRSNQFLKVNQALNECGDLFLSYGGHAAAGGFTIKEENINLLKEKLNNIAYRELSNFDISKSISPEAHIDFNDINNQFYDQLKKLGPFGIQNKAPIFWTRKCKILALFNLKGGHLKLKLWDGTSVIDAIKWNNSYLLKLNDLIDIAFRIEMNIWNKTKKLQLNLIDIKKYSQKVTLSLHNRNYTCELINSNDIKITNNHGQIISSASNLNTFRTNSKDQAYIKKVLSFAQIALGQET
tara:strand:+ start:11725 stop:13590 length:1866 start_codon:yes stop_codon:yes gene_type:complete